MSAPTPGAVTGAHSPTIHLVLVRHAESLHNRDGEKINVDSGLTELGWRQAHAAAAWLAARYRPDLLLSSTLTRARQTAEVIATRLSMPVRMEQGLEEAEFQYWDELPYRWQNPLDPWRDVWRPNSETAPLYSSFRARVHDTLERMLAQLPADRPNVTLLVVTHGGVIGTLMRGLFGGHHVAVFTANTGVTQFSWELNHWRLVFHNETSHLDALAPGRAVAPAAATQTGAAPWTNGQNAPAIMKHYQRVAASTQLGPHPGDRELRELVRLTSPLGEEQVLDVATGAGTLALAFAPRVSQVTGVDLSPAMLERAEAARSAAGLSNVHFRLGEIGVLPLEDGAFDIIAWHNLLEYILDLPALLALFRRLLAQEGRLAFDELTGSEDAVKRATLAEIMSRRDPGINDVMSASEIEAALKRAGFRVLKIERYTISRDVDEWLSRAAADEATRGTVRSMIEAGLDADSAGLSARRTRDGNIAFTESRARVLAALEKRPG
jgi:broad specificity phosphatase PhoE/ubiquinone/menaquinone biosynthesis C-methylase UbiE